MAPSSDKEAAAITADTVPITDFSEVLRNIRSHRSSQSNLILPSEPIADTPLDQNDRDILVFAKLAPSNRAACRAFDAIARKIQADPNWKQHHRQFIVIEGLNSLLNTPKIFTEEYEEASDAETPLFEDDLTASESDAPSTSAADTVLSGYYQLSLDLVPQFPRIGWRLGSGRSRHANDAVDFLLTPPNWPNAGVAGLHARLQFERRSGTLMLVASNLRGMPVVLNGQRYAHDTRVISRPKNVIEFGDLSYNFIYTINSSAQEKRFQESLNTYFTYAFGTEPQLSLSATPSAHDRELGDYILRNTLAKGGSGIVSVASHARTGNPVAVKEILRTRWNHMRVDSEISIFKSLKHERLAELFDVFYERGESRYNMRDSPERIYLFLTLAKGTFRALFTPRIEFKDRIEFFKQGLEGIAFLHRQGIMHRDIKPANLAVKSFDPPAALIIDYGCATQELRSKENPGTVPYLAPEVRNGSWHNRAVDIWSYGIVGLELFLLRDAATAGTPRLSLPALSLIHSRLQRDSSQRSIETLLLRLLRWDATDRLSAADALKHPCLQGSNETAAWAQRRHPSPGSGGGDPLRLKPG